jgi:Dolichyl-phosphate-mannose-protein mannosyltransferase
VSATTHSSDDRSGRLGAMAAALILLVTVFRIVYLFFLCPYDLAPDEAHYWDWSRHLDWSYYSKGPLVAWIIRAGCELFGEPATTWHGTLMPAVRVPAVFFGSALLLSLYILTRQTFGNGRLALGVIFAVLSLPPFTACSILMTIDSPFLCCWGWALVFGRWAMIDGKAWAWPAAGAAVALGILAKYTMALWLVSAGLFVLFTPSHRRLLLRPGLWVMTLTAGLSAIPILVWNSQHDWVTFRHVAVQAGVSDQRPEGIRWMGPLEYLAGQFALLLGLWFLAWVGSMIVFRPRAGVEPGVRYLWWLSLPTFLVFAGSSLRSSGQLNWPVAAYVSGAVLVAGWLPRLLNSHRRGLRRAARWAFGGIVGFGFVVTAIAHDTRLVTRHLGGFAGEETPTRPTPIRAFDPAARLKGWHYLCQQIDLRRDELRRDGKEPVIAGTRWDVPGELGFYCDGHPQVYSIGLAVLDRHSQYDLWHPNPIDEAEAFRGETFIVVGSGDPLLVLLPAFEQVGEPQDVVYREHGRAVAVWTIRVCRGFREFNPALRSSVAPRH